MRQQQTYLIFGFLLGSLVSLTGCSEIYRELPESVRDTVLEMVINSQKDELTKEVEIYIPKAWDFERLSEKVRANPNNAMIYRNRGRAYYHARNENYKEALEDYNKAISLDPSRAKWYDERASILNLEDREEEALKDCDTAIRMDSKDGSFYGTRASIYDELGRFEEACKDYEKAAKFDPSNYANDWANALAKCGKESQALEVFHKVMSDVASYDRSQAHEDAIAIYVRQGKLDLARKTVNAWKTALPDETEPFEYSAKMFELVGENEAAKIDYRQLVKLYEKEDAKGDDIAGYQWTERAKTYDRLNETDKAKEARKKALASYVADGDEYLTSQADLYEKLGEVDKAKELRARDQKRDLEKAEAEIAESPKDGDGYDSRAVVLEQMKRYDESLRDYERAIALDPDDTVYIGHYADLLNTLKRYDESLKICKAALKKDPNDSTLIGMISEASEQLGRHDDAVKFANTWIGMEPENGEGYFWRSQAYKKLGKKDLAQRDLLMWNWLKSEGEEDPA